MSQVSLPLYTGRIDGDLLDKHSISTRQAQLLRDTAGDASRRRVRQDSDEPFRLRRCSPGVAAAGSTHPSAPSTQSEPTETPMKLRYNHLQQRLSRRAAERDGSRPEKRLVGTGKRCQRAYETRFTGWTKRASASRTCILG